MQRPARQRSTRAARHDLDLLAPAIGHHRRHFIAVGRQHGDQRLLAIGGQAVAFIGRQTRGMVDYHSLRQQPGKRSGDGGAPSDDPGIGYRHVHESPLPRGRPS
jgi:hypothetical protein